MIEHNSKLARNPAHLRRLIAFWPEENIVHQLAKNALADIERQKNSADWLKVPVRPTKGMLRQAHTLSDATCPDCGKGFAIDVTENVTLSWDDMLQAAKEEQE